MFRHSNWKNKKTCFLIIIPLTLFTLIAISFYFLKNDLIALLDRYYLIPRNESFTELYFADHLALPKNLDDGRLLDFSFVIASHENRDQSYRYEVSYADNEKNEKIKTGETMVKAGEKANIEIAYVLPSAEKAYRIDVRLPDSEQSIHFYLNKK